MNTADHAHREHFADLEQQAIAAHLGLWIFLASEVLLFAGLFMLYGALRLEHPAAFRAGIHHADKTLGSINTGVLLLGSAFVAFGVHALRAGRRRAAAGLTALTVLSAIAFLAVKLTEYASHLGEGIAPGGRGAFFVAHADPGLPPFWTLYYTATGLHAVHVFVGAIVLVVLVIAMARGRLDVRTAYRLECGAIYWHLVDLFWIFLWPLFYLA